MVCWFVGLMVYGDSRHRFFRDLLDADEFGALELKHDLVECRAAHKRGH